MTKHIYREIKEYDELLEMLEISDPEEFEYFENMADLIECEHDIADELLIELFGDVDEEVLKELIESYFTDILGSVPDRASDIYVLINTIGMNLLGLAGEKDRGRGKLSTLAEEFNRFKKWYMRDTEVECREVHHGDGTQILTVAEALTLSREESLSDKKYEYDFESALDFPMSDYVMSFGDLASAEYAENDDDDDYYEHDHDDTEYMRSRRHAHPDDCDCGHHHGHSHGSGGGHAHIEMREGFPFGFASEDILNHGFVYEDESAARSFSDDDDDEYED